LSAILDICFSFKKRQEIGAFLDSIHTTVKLDYRGGEGGDGGGLDSRKRGPATQ